MAENAAKELGYLLQSRNQPDAKMIFFFELVRLNAPAGRRTRNRNWKG
jgi:hypothetical protein